MESGRILDEQISASSSFDPLSTSPIHSRPTGSNGRLNTESGSGAWCPSSQINDTSHEWIQVELADEYFIVGVRTQGRWDKGRGLEFPSAYMIEYWRPSLGRWARYKDSTGNEDVSLR
uniref:F5/8 type C domain-containing protein n=1 Tax=Meloidogyne incognita TaxID=6306 RepID=A0A914M4M2_MELIC